VLVSPRGWPSGRAVIDVVLHWAAPAPGALRTPGIDVAPAVAFTVGALVASLLLNLRLSRYWYLPQLDSGAAGKVCWWAGLRVVTVSSSRTRGRCKVPFSAEALPGAQSQFDHRT